ncbi:hypothetical protein MTO96_009326 [Rhipicephalus appendiculatus]
MSRLHSRESATGVKGGTTRTNKSSPTKGPKDDLKTATSMAPAEHPHPAFHPRKSVSAKGQDDRQHVTKPASASGPEGAPQTTAARRKSAAPALKPSSVSSQEERMNVTSGSGKSLAHRKKSVSIKVHDEQRHATGISRKLECTTVAGKKFASLKGSEEQPQTAAGKRAQAEHAPAAGPEDHMKIISGLSKSSMPRNKSSMPRKKSVSIKANEEHAPAAGPEDHMKIISGLSKSSMPRKKSVSIKANEEHALAGEHDTRMARKKSIAAPKTAPPAVAEFPGQGQEDLEPRSHIDGEEAAGGKSGLHSKQQRPRIQRKMPTTAPFLVAKMMGTATKLAATRTPVKKGSRAEKRAELFKSVDKEESGHSELDSLQQRCLALGGALACTAVLFLGLTAAIYFSKGKSVNTLVRRVRDSRVCSCAQVHGRPVGLSAGPVQGLLSATSAIRWEEKGSSFAQGPGRTPCWSPSTRRLREYAKPPDPLGGHLVVSVYRGCRTYVASPDVLGPALSFTEDKVMSGLMRGAKNFTDVVELMARTSLQAGLHTVLWMGLESSETGEKATLRMAPGKSILRKLGVADYGELQRVLHTTFTWLPKVYKKDRLSTVIAIDQVVEDALGSKSSGTEAPLSTSTRRATGPLSSFVVDLVPGMDANAWMEALNDVLPEKHRIDAADNVTAVAWASIRGTFGALASHDVPNASFYLGANLDSEVAYLEMSRQKLKSAGDAKVAKFCLEQCRRIPSLAWESLMGELQADRYLSDGAGTVAEMFTTLAHSVKRNSTLTWIPDDVRLQARQAPPARRDVLFQLLEPYGPVSFEGDLEAILVPSMYLRDPYLYPHGVPMYYNFGTLGTQLATAMAQALNKDPGSGAASKSSSWWTDETRERHNRSLQCLESLYQRMGFEFGGGARGEQEALFIWVQGVRLAYQALMNSFGELASHEDDAVLYMQTARRTFFSRSCLLWCSSETTGGPLSPRQRCMVPLHNMREFADTFGCTDRLDFVQGECEA